MNLKVIGGNIRQLRIEARLSEKEFAEKAGVNVEKVQKWENGELMPLTKELIVICPILHINQDDLLERDIVSEREEANKRLKKSASNDNYKWYYGSKKVRLFYILAIVLIPLVFIVSFLIIKNTVNIEELSKYYIEQGMEVPITLTYCYIIYPYIISAFVGLIFMAIDLIRRFKSQFRLWHLFLVIFLWSVIMFISLLLLIPYYIFCIVELITKWGKVRA